VNRPFNQRGTPCGDWLGALRSIAARATTDPDYAHLVGCVLTGLTPDVSAAGPGAAARIFGHAMVSPLAGAPWHRLCRGRSARLARDGLGDSAGYPAAPDELRNWAAGTGLALVEFASQLTRATSTQSR
jgi:hypothetical protein